MSDGDMIEQANPFKEKVIRRNTCDYISNREAKAIINYITISSNSIVGNNADNMENNENKELAKNILSDLNKKSCLILYFEFQYYLLWGKDYIKTVYPDNNNIVIIFIINDDVYTQETIFLQKSEKLEDKSSYVPILKEGDAKVNYYII
jgi:hypothetical protein